MEYRFKQSNKFIKDLKNCKKRGYNLELLSVVINDYLKKGAPLPSNYFDHNLKGQYQDKRDCHITPDWILIYEVDKQNSILYLARTGTHSDLF